MAINYTPDFFSEKERQAWESIMEAYTNVQNMDERRGLTCNTAELAQACHVFQDFVKQHALHRIEPNEFSDWWDEVPFEVEQIPNGKKR